ncbi:hypothetical protein Ade02nite_61570 [Paractinoplanes deccanensis]|uniref:DUF222 domain-containing protein n=1 Tax=Paractinoplanes deccanensis TaxID=113561 RepID=A0ABQ3YC22_9ACTN|nr:hypothetical protein [Actinoplanes deccanensis]GID77516.1 hypothetical protein Ade02nite_61570 [Actinoplanes deccanensis]
MTDVVDLRGLFFDDPADAAGAMTGALTADDLGGVLSGMPEAARKATLSRIGDAAAGLLELDLTEILCSGWGRHGQVLAAARAGMAEPETQRRVALAAHAISVVHRPSLEVHVGAQTTATVPLEVRLEMVIRGLQAVVRAGRLAGVEAGTCDIDGSLSIAGRPLVRRRASLALPMIVHLPNGWPLAEGEYQAG